LQKTVKDRYDKLGVDYLGRDNIDYEKGQIHQQSSPLYSIPTYNHELLQYFYHSDHLGSTSLITDVDGNVTQHIEYVPFGEVFIEERNNTWNTPFLFNAKELDEETGLYYYGARYYEPRASMWLSTDPLQEKYPGISTYAYCNNNPVNAIDIDGRDGIFITFPDYKISTPIGKIGNLGHAGVLLIDNKTGVTKYYEYGRYDKPQKGIVKTFSVSNVKIGTDGKPTQESLNKVLAQISKEKGQGGKIEGAYVKSNKFKEMNDYAKSKMAENSDPKRKEYSLTNNNCGTFAADVLKQDSKVKDNAPTTIIARPNGMVKDWQDKFDKITYDPVKVKNKKNGK